MSLATAPRPGALGNWPSNVPGAYGMGSAPAPPGAGQITSGLSDDADYNKRVIEAAKLLGPPPDTSDLDLRGHFPREITLLPDLWAGPGGRMRSNTRLTEAVIFFMDQSVSELISAVAPVVVFRGNPVVQMSVLYFHRAKVEPYMHLGVPKLVSYTWDQWDTSIERVGLGGEFDEEMLGTEKGTSIVLNTIKQIQIAILDYVAIDLIHALLAAVPQPANFYEAHNLPVRNEQAMSLFRPELDMWGCIQCKDYGLAKLATYATNRIRLAQGDEPDIVIMPQEIATYMRFSRPELTRFIEAGDRGVARREGSEKNVLTSQLAGLRIMPSPLIPDSRGGAPRDPLAHIRQIGEFYLMDADWHSHVDFKSKPNAAELSKAARTIYLHDNVSDAMKPITIDALNKFFKDKKTLKNVTEFLKDHKDFHVLLLRPNMVYQMGCFIFLKGGGSTAESHIGFGDARWGRDATRKKALLHYTTYAGAVVKKPQNVFIANNVDTKQYLRGGGVKLGKDIFPVLVKKDADPNELDRIRDEPFLGITDDTWNGILAEPERNTIPDVKEWAAAYGFRKNETHGPDEGVMYNRYKGWQQFNARVFRGGCRYAQVDVEGRIVNPMGNRVLGQGHWGKWVKDGIGASRMGQGDTPYVRGDPDLPQITF